MFSHQFQDEFPLTGGPALSDISAGDRRSARRKATYRMSKKRPYLRKTHSCQKISKKKWTSFRSPQSYLFIGTDFVLKIMQSGGWSPRAGVGKMKNTERTDFFLNGSVQFEIEQLWILNGRSKQIPNFERGTEKVRPFCIWTGFERGEMFNDRVTGARESNHTISQNESFWATAHGELRPARQKWNKGAAHPNSHPTQRSSKAPPRNTKISKI